MMKSNMAQTSLNSSCKYVFWTAPTSATLKLNFDAFRRGHEARIGFVLRDEWGKPVMMGAKKVTSLSINQLELMAVAGPRKFYSGHLC